MGRNGFSGLRIRERSILVFRKPQLIIAISIIQYANNTGIILMGNIQFTALFGYLPAVLIVRPYFAFLVIIPFKRGDGETIQEYFILLIIVVPKSVINNNIGWRRFTLFRF